MMEKSAVVAVAAAVWFEKRAGSFGLKNELFSGEFREGSGNANCLYIRSIHQCA